MNIKDLKNNINSVIVGGKIAKIFLDVDNNNKKYCKLIIENSKLVKNSQIITSVKCYAYNKSYNLIKNNGFEINDLVEITGELQNRNNKLVVFVKNIIKK